MRPRAIVCTAATAIGIEGQSQSLGYDWASDSWALMPLTHITTNTHMCNPVVKIID